MKLEPIVSDKSNVWFFDFLTKNSLATLMTELDVFSSRIVSVGL